MATSTERPMLKEPFTHDDVDEFYSQMYSKYVNDPEKPYDLRTLEAVHEFFEFESDSGMTLDAWLHAQIQKVNGRSYLPTTKWKPNTKKEVNAEAANEQG